ncbi:MAG: polysaccharide pyruvyl transferase family protein, partial [Cyanobacteria bacterium J06636_28]
PEPKIIFVGSGAGYGKVNVQNGRFKIYFVRGRLTSKLLGIPEEKAITDPAILVKSLYQTTDIKKRYKMSYMPHHLESEMNREGWQQVCADCGVNYIDPGSSVEQVLDEIRATDVLFTEAMHGAIIADAFRVPWVPMVTNEKILEFKWRDWMDGLGIAYEPRRIKRLYRGISNQIFPKLPKYIDYQLICRQFRATIQNAQPLLSTDSKSKDLHEKVYVQVEQLKKDYASGLLL